VSPVATSASYSITAGGPAVTVFVSPAGTTSSATFTGNAGQRVSLNITGVNITSSRVSLQKPGGVNIASFTVTRAGYFLDVRTLPVNGTYKIVVDPKQNYTGKMTLRLYNVLADPTGTILNDGTPAQVVTTTPGQNATLTFSGTIGQRVSLDLNSSTYKSGKLKILNPDASLLFPTALTFTQAGRFMEPKVLPATGTYTIVIDPKLLSIGQAWLQLFVVPADTTGTVATNGTPSTVTTTGPGQNALLTFSGTAGQRVSGILGNSLYTSLVQVSILNPDSTLLYSPAVPVGAFDAFIDTQTLPTTGTYTVLVDPQGVDTGSLDIRLYDVPADVNGGALTSGVAATVTTVTPGQNAYFTYAGTINQRISVELPNGTYGDARVSILRPDGLPLFTPSRVVTPLGDFIDPKILPATGTYKIVVDPQGADLGSLDAKLWVLPADVSSSLSNGVPKTVQITTPGQQAHLTYAGTNGQRLFVRLNNSTLGTTGCCGAKVRVLNANGTNRIAWTDFGTDGKSFDPFQITATGTYKIDIDPQGALTGNVDVTVSVVPADPNTISAAPTAAGTAANVTTTAPGQNATVSFTGALNQRFAWKLVSFSGASGYCTVKIKLVRPNGTVKSNPVCSSDGDFFDTRVLDAAGTWKIFIDPQGAAFGTTSLVLYSVPADVVTTLGASSSVTLTPGQNAYLSFTATSSQTATVTPQTGGTINLIRASLVKADKKTQVGAAQYWDPATGGASVDSAGTLPAAGTYYLFFDPEGAASGTSMTFGLTLT
jgi:hypothetical protein